MSRIYLPTSEQMDDTVSSLGKIARVLGSKVDLSTWKGIQRAVRWGIAPDVLPVGTQLVANHSRYGDIVFDVVAHDYFKSVDDENAHTMTILMHNCVDKAQYDAVEAFYYAENELPAGTYNFTIAEKYTDNWTAGTYQFTSTVSLPKDGRLSISGTKALTSEKVKLYSGDYSWTAMESCAISVGSGGTSLGALATTTSPTSELNHIDRVYGGSNNYKESAIRHFVNTEGGWSPLTKFDMYPSAPIDIFIFQDGFGEDFLNAVGEVYVPCATNHAYEIPGGDKIKQSYEVLDKFYLPSHNEIFGTTTNSPSDGTIIFPYYAEATDADRIKYAGGLATAWWTRSANRWYANRVECVDLNGKRVTKNANITAGIAVACTIVGGQHDKYSE